MKYVVLAIVGGVLGFLISRLLVPFVLERGVLVFVVLLLLLVAVLLFVRALRRARSGS